MRILIINDSPSAPFYYKEGFRKVLEYCGHQVAYYNPQDSLFDIFYQFKPDLLYSNSYSLDSQTIKVLQKYDTTRVILRANDWGNHLSEIGPEYPIGKVGEQEIQNVAALKTLIKDRLCFVFTHYHPNQIKRTMHGWEDHLGIKAVGLNNSCDTFSYVGGCYKEELECDISFIGGFWGYKSNNLKPYIFPLCSMDTLNVKIFGNGTWPVGQYLGMLSEENVKNLFKSSLINLNIHEPHSNRWGYDVVERPFKILGAGGFVISDYVESLVKDYFPNGGIVTADSPKDLFDQIGYYLDKPDERAKIAAIGQNTVLNNHTYFNQCQRLFEEIGEKQLAAQVNIKHKLFLMSLSKGG